MTPGGFEQLALRVEDEPDALRFCAAPGWTPGADPSAPSSRKLASRAVGGRAASLGACEPLGLLSGAPLEFGETAREPNSSTTARRSAGRSPSALRCRASLANSCVRPPSSTLLSASHCCSCAWLAKPCSASPGVECPADLVQGGCDDRGLRLPGVTPAQGPGGGVWSQSGSSKRAMSSTASSASLRAWRRRCLLAGHERPPGAGLFEEEAGSCGGDPRAANRRVQEAPPARRLA